MKYKSSLLSIAFLAVLTLFSCSDKQSGSSHKATTVENDPLNTQMYTLSNGLKVYLTVFEDEPRIQTYIAVKAGSKYDPSETTGLAHYLEHMVFKGTQEIGALNWEKEKVVLDAISDKYEQHKAESDPEKKTAIYKQIDSLSYEASKLVATNEYDKMIKSLGASGTNAYTSNDRTVYVNNIPANELDKWLKVESERFSQLVLRLFHTELETVYEEFNRSQDNDGRWAFEAVLNGLFPNHPYGTQSTIGLGEHLKNPSMVNIHDYFDKYYVPNNVAICLSGDFDPDATIALIEKHFGSWERKDVPEFVMPVLPEIKEPVIKEIFGPDEESVYVGFRTGGASSSDATMLKLMDMILSNRQAGLIDINLNQQQKVLTAQTFPFIRRDFSAHYFYGKAREGQSLEEVKDLLLEQIEKLKSGEFEDWLLKAVIKDLKLSQMRAFESNSGRANQYVVSFTEDVPYQQMVNEFAEMEKVTKEQLVKFANEMYKDNNYVIVYKRQGESKNRHKVDKPQITPVEVNNDTMSPFARTFYDQESNRLSPAFLDFDKEIQKSKCCNDQVDFYSVENKMNDIFGLNYILEMGSSHDKEMALAIEYLPYLGTDKFTAEELQKEFYKYGLSFNVNAGSERTYVTLSGLEESLEKGVELFEHILNNVVADEEAFNNMVAGILKQRMDDKSNKQVILNQAMFNYAKSGPVNEFTNVLSQQELQSMDVNKLIEKIKSISSFKHMAYYYGKQPDMAKKLLNKYHKIPGSFAEVPEKIEIAELDTDENKVLFVQVDGAVQAQMLMLSKNEKFNKDLLPFASIFNQYFGAGLSSIVFQQIREQKALAYAAYSYFTYPSKKDDSHYVRAYIGTQADKMPDAIKAMKDLMSEMPMVDRSYQSAKESAMKRIETNRTTGPNIFRTYLRTKDRGLSKDLNEDMYPVIKTMELEQLKSFFDDNIKGNTYTYAVMGDKKVMNIDALRELGDVQELTLEQIFGY